VDLRQIEYVEAVARFASFTRAAEEVHIAQPALSAAIRRLETELGVQLFDRSSRRVSLTDAGQAFLMRARKVLDEIGQINGEMNEYAGGTRGLLRISWWYHVDYQMTAFLQRFTKVNPSVGVSIVEWPTPEAITGLCSGELDIASVVLGDGLDLSDIDHRVMRQETYVLATPMGHPLAGRTSVSIDEILHEPFIAARPGTALRRCFDRAFAGRDFAPHIVVETNELAGLATFVSMGIGDAILTPSIASRAGVPLATVPLADARPFIQAAAWRKGPRSQIVQRAIEVVEDLLPVVAVG